MSAPGCFSSSILFAMVRKYIVCECPRCPAYPGSNLRSWRNLPKPGIPDTGPSNCRFCQTPFRIPLISDGHRKGGGGNGGGGGGGGGAAARSGSGKDSKGANDQQWYGRSSKGRIRKVQIEDSGESEVQAQEAILEEMLKQRLADKPNLAGVADDIVRECFPKKPKSPKEVLHDGMTAVDKARSTQEHLTKVCAQMQASYERRFQELVEYKSNLDEHYTKLESAKKAFAQANAALLELQASAVETPAPQNLSGSAIQLEQIKQVAETYNPTAGIARAFASLPQMEQLDSATARVFGDAMTSEFRNQLAMFCSQFNPSPLAPPSAPPPPSDPPQPALVPNRDSDALMTDKAAKRGIEEILSGEDVIASMQMMEDVAHVSQNQMESEPSSNAARDSARAKELADRVQVALQNRGRTAEGQSSS